MSLCLIKCPLSNVHGNGEPAGLFPTPCQGSGDDTVLYRLNDKDQYTTEQTFI